jgi:hypothetical protein
MRKERRGEKGKRETEQLEYAYWRRVDLKRERESVCVCVWGQEEPDTKRVNV